MRVQIYNQPLSAQISSHLKPALGGLFMVKNIRYSIINGLFGDKKSLKAIALLLFLYRKTGQNVICRWSYNKIAAITGAHTSTVKKRVETLVQMELVHFEGSTLVFRSVVSRHSDRNINIKNIKYDSLRDVEKSLYAILLCVIQARKDFCKRTIRQAQESRQYKVVKKARALIRRCGWGDSYCEHGLSYRGIAKKLGCSIKTAFDYVRFAVEKGFVLLENHFLRSFMKNVNKYPVPGFTFTTNNYAYKVSANTYTVLCDIFDMQRSGCGAH